MQITSPIRSELLIFLPEEILLGRTLIWNLLGSLARSFGERMRRSGAVEVESDFAERQGRLPITSPDHELQIILRKRNFAGDTRKSGDLEPRKRL
jgi:hypothetical protein